MTNKIRILIIDDEESHAQAAAEALERVGFDCRIATSGREGISVVRDHGDVDVVLTDLVMPDVDGLEVLDSVRKIDPTLEVILLTGRGNVQTAVTAMRKGAYHYLEKPINIEELRTVVEKAAQRKALVMENRDLRSQIDERFGFEGIIGNSPGMRRAFDTIVQIAPTNATVLITGESGTGKELVAKALHVNSPRRQERFVPLHCAAISEGILESELFGHVKGSFTGATRDRIGRFEYANGGTLFLDEVGDMPIPTQVKLLRVIDQGEFNRVGSNDLVRVDVRLLAATNHDLAARVEEHKFREDLYFRLKVVTICLPPLRERLSDVPVLIDTFIHELTVKHGKRIASAAPEVIQRLSSYAWPGNVRELKNCIESMVVMAKGDTLDVDLLPEQIRAAETRFPIAPLFTQGVSLDDAEKDLIRNTLALTKGNREEAAKILKIGERTLYRKLKKYGLS
ncbi:MAG: sigma-54 dependent transcriptional regulator [Planctomycetota bacterium]